jgi:hypothetical protein
MVRKNKPFPFGNEGPPDKLTEAQKREILPDEIRGYIPPISMAAAVQLKQQGVSSTSLLVLQLLVREKKIEGKRQRSTDNLRVPSSVRRHLKIGNQQYINSLRDLDQAGAIKINDGRKRTASILIDTETQVRQVWEDMHGNKKESRW